MSDVVTEEKQGHTHTHRERERERERYIYIYIYIYREREREILRFANHLSFFVSEAASGILKLELDLQKSDSRFTRA